METEEEQKILNSSNSSITALVPGGVVTTQNISTVIRPKGNSNSLQFVKIQTPELSKKAVEQIRIADETKISKEKIKETEEEWQNNLLNWKSKRRQQLSHSVDYEPDQSLDNNNDCGTRKVKTFAEMIEQRVKSGNRLSFHLQRYASTEDGEDEGEGDNDTEKDKDKDNDNDNDNGSCNSSGRGSESERQPPPLSLSEPIAQPVALARQTSPSVEQESSSPSPTHIVKQEPQQAIMQRALSPVKETIKSQLPETNSPSILPQSSPPARERSLSPVKKSFPLVKPIPPPNKPNPPSIVRICPPIRQNLASLAPQQQQQPQYSQNSPRIMQHKSPIPSNAASPIIRTSTPVTTQSSSPPLESQPSPSPPPIPQPSPPSMKQMSTTQQCKQSPQPTKQIISPILPTCQKVKPPAPPPPPAAFKQTTPTPARQAPQPVKQIPPPVQQTPPPVNQSLPPVKQSLSPVMRSCPPLAMQTSPSIAQTTSPIRTPSISPKIAPVPTPPEVTPSHRSQPKLNNREDKDKTVLSISGKKRCSSCKEELGRGAAAFVVESLSLVYHTNCFRCSVCHMNLSNGFRGVDVRVHAGQLHCQNCYSKDGLSYSRV